VLFSEGLQQYRDLLEPGSAVLLMLSAELQGDEVRARIQMVEPLDKAAAKLQKALRVFLRSEARSRAWPNGSMVRVMAKSRGAVLGQGTEVEVKLPGRFKVSPQSPRHQGDPGVIEVQAL